MQCLKESAQRAAAFGVRDNQLVQVRIPGVKATVFENVQIRIRDGWRAEMHLDTDDGNAAGVVTGDPAEILEA